ncbi:hypothetical protein H9Q08_14445 [Chryseobacterium sp. PS-8]|uniref:SPX domain-containing protein n=1 Tax=Chryseobacterium indicum TaxID=2766954 RepID=A0ABS9C9X9_9FLAO|nr:hypothetical protein [Chryseobacterium sp. PS-8]MCF2220484.1 hypothetical protein [Chryseobacterium sp. PS-8]
MILLQIQTNLNKIADSITTNKEIMQNIDMLNKLENFYNDAWNKLIIYLSIFNGLAIIIIPLLLYFINKHFKDDFNNFFKSQLDLEVNKINSEQKELVQENIKKIKEEFEIEKQIIRKENLNTINIIRHNAEAVGYHLQADIFADKKEYKNALLNYITTMISCIIGKDKSNFIEALEGLKKIVEHIKLKDFEELNKENSKYSNIEFLIYLMQHNRENIDYAIQKDYIETQLTKIEYKNIYPENILNKFKEEIYEYNP